MSGNEALREQVATLEELARRQRENKLAYYAPYPKQRQWHDMSATKRCSAIISANQGGKSFASAMQIAIFATGRYPEWWAGKRFPNVTRGWVAGVSGTGVRDTMQRLLLGPLGAQGTGTIPAECIDSVRMSRGSPDTVDSILVRHGSGHLSQISFKSYEQGTSKFAGETLQYVALDEEPPADIFSECLARISATKGVLFASFTPLMGMTDVVRRFLSSENPDYGYVQSSLEDAGHFTPEERARIEAGYQPHERDARVRGIPMLGSGRVFQIAEDMIAVEPFPIPRHWRRIVGMDIGVDHPTAAAFLAIDLDSDTVYVTDTHRLSSPFAAVHAQAIKAKGGATVPVAWPHDALQRETSGETVAALYRSMGLNMLKERATFPDGGNSVEAGILEMSDRMVSGRLKVFRHLNDWWEEFRMYHRKNGALVKLQDDLLSATRYGLMMLRYAKPGDHDSTRRRAPQMAEGVNYDPLDSDDAPSARNAGGESVLWGNGRPPSLQRR